MSARKRGGILADNINRFHKSLSVFFRQRIFFIAYQKSKLVATAALRRKNSIGAHYRADFPHLSVENNKNEGSMIYDKILVK